MRFARARAVFAGFLAALPLACGSGDGGGADAGGDGPADTSGPPVVVGSGEYTIRIDPGAREIALLRGTTPLLRFPADGLEIGTVPALDDARNYDPYPLVVPSGLDPPPEGLAFVAPVRFDAAAADAGGATVSIEYPGGARAALAITAPRPGAFALKLVPEGKTPAVAYFRLRPRADAKEGFYGLGEYYDDVSSRGHVRAMQLEVDGKYESSLNEAHVPVPFVVGTRGWGLFVECPYPGVFSVATDEPDLVEATFGTGLASSEGIAFHLYGAGHPLDVPRHYYEDTGYPRLPARWALGPWIWRDESKDQAEVESDLNAIRDQDLATTAYWIDRPYATAVNTFDFKPSQFPAPQKMLDVAKALGFRVALWHSPYLDEKSAEQAATAALREEAQKKGYYPPEVGFLANHWGRPIDLTNPAAFAFWQALVKKYTAMGIAGYKLDYGEDVVPGLASGRNVWRFADGSDERTMHSRFQLFYHRVYAETLPPEGGFLLVRHGTYGDQTISSVVWPGDLDASFARRGEKATAGGKTYTAVGGLEGSVVAGLSLGVSGYPFYGSDTGGYIHSPPDKELFTRWCEQTALSTVMQVGNGGSTVPWEPDAKTGYDAEMLGSYRTYARLHLRLFPYEWTHAQRIAQDGRPIARALGLAFPDLGVHPNDEYLFGDDLLVAPVLDRGKTSREVVFPPGRWIDWWSGKAYDGGTTATVPAPLGVLPLFLAEGGVVPMLRPTIDAMAPTTDPARVDSYATSAGVLWVRTAAGPKGSFAVFDGTEIAQEAAGKTVSLSVKGGSEFSAGAMFELVASGGKPASVAIDGTPATEAGSLAALQSAPSGWTFDPATGGTVWIKVPAGAHAVQILVP